MQDFSDIGRIKMKQFEAPVAVIKPGELFVSAAPDVVFTVLGSCISACIRDPLTLIGGMNHFMLPKPKREIGDDDPWEQSARYGSFAMELLINEILERGGAKNRLEAKLFGGGKIYESSYNVGADNEQWVLDFLKTEGIKVISQDLGDVWPRKVFFCTDSGRALVKRVPPLDSDEVKRQERDYESKLDKENTTEDCDVTLF